MSKDFGRGSQLETDVNYWLNRIGKSRHEGDLTAGERVYLTQLSKRLQSVLATMSRGDSVNPLAVRDASTINAGLLHEANHLRSLADSLEGIGNMIANEDN